MRTNLALPFILVSQSLLLGQGAEVFNSYGRRSNENLLVEYGFAMMDNEWERVDTVVCNL
jgi:hypothetical protein